MYFVSVDCRNNTQSSQVVLKLRTDLALDRFLCLSDHLVPSYALEGDQKKPVYRFGSQGTSQIQWEGANFQRGREKELE